MVKITFIRVVLTIGSNDDLFLERLDVHIVFLHEGIYMHQPKGLMVQGKDCSVCILKKVLYDLKQDPIECYKKVDMFMHNEWYTRCQPYHYCYIRHFDSSYIIMLL